MNPRAALLEKVETLQNIFISYATGGQVDENEFKTLRDEILSDPLVKGRLPPFIRTHKDFKQFWPFIKEQSATYQGRRVFLREQFGSVLEFLESPGSPADQSVTEILAKFDLENVHRTWTKALDRRSEDPEGAITMARTLLETVCRHILDEMGVTYQIETTDLPRLYRLTSEVLSLAPSQHSEQVFKQIFGGCQTVVEGIGAMRNKLSDAHGKGKAATKVHPHYADLAVNLAGTMATFLVAICTEQHGRKS